LDDESISSAVHPSRVNDTEVFESLYRRHASAVLRYAIKCVGRREIAEDLTSDAFLALYRNLASIDQTRLPAWLFTVVAHAATSYWRHSVVEQKYAATVEDQPRSAEPTVDLASILQIPELKPQHRACLVLRYAHDMDRPEIAARLGMTENQVKSCLQYGLELLRRSLREKEDYENQRSQ
jgi:RNA polymerase sigma-70 factor (ECF subfamily)